MKLYLFSFVTVVVCNTTFSFSFAPGKFSRNGIIDNYYSPSSVSPQVQARKPVSLFVDDETSMAVPGHIPRSRSIGKSLGLITFDLDDTLFPIATVIKEANEAFSKAMAKFGYEGVDPKDITFTSKSMREEMQDDEDGDTLPLTYTELRLRAIRYEMERFITGHKLQQIAIGTATSVDCLHHAVVASAELNAKRAVHSSVVQMVYNAWELERHYSAERNLYPDALEMLQRIKNSHPGVIIGAITDGKANPLIMENTLSPYFDFCVSWEDEDVFPSRKPDPKIFAAALSRHKSLVPAGDDEIGENSIWIHVGDDLAYDIGGSAACGAKTIWADLIDDYGQTAKLRENGEVPAWSTALPTELKKRNALAKEARDCVDSRVQGLHDIPEAIMNIVK